MDDIGEILERLVSNPRNDSNNNAEPPGEVEQLLNVVLDKLISRIARDEALSKKGKQRVYEDVMISPTIDGLKDAVRRIEANSSTNSHMKKAFKILAEKKVDLELIKCKGVSTYRSYNDLASNNVGYKDLTEDEFKTLKRAFKEATK